MQLFVMYNQTNLGKTQERHAYIYDINIDPLLSGNEKYRLHQRWRYSAYEICMYIDMTYRWHLFNFKRKYYGWECNIRIANL